MTVEPVVETWEESPRLLAVARSRDHALALAHETRCQAERVEPDQVVLLIGALCDDGVVIELAIREEPLDPVSEVAALIAANHCGRDFGQGDLPAWGYFVVMIGMDDAPSLDVTLRDIVRRKLVPTSADLAWLDMHAADHGVEVVDWLLVLGGGGVSYGMSLHELFDDEWRWLEPRP